MDTFTSWVKRLWWKLTLATIAVVSVIYYLYRLVASAEKTSPMLDSLRESTSVALKESEIRATLKKESIGAIKIVYETRLKGTKEIKDRTERLNALIKLYEELGA
jgi:hypothetical protein